MLDFEKPIFELESKLAEMQQLAIDSNVDVTEAVKQLEEKIKKIEKRYLSKPHPLATCTVKQASG